MTSKITNIELYNEKGQYYLKVEYEVDNVYRLEKYTVPKIHLPIADCVTIIHESDNTYMGMFERNAIDLGFGELNMLRDKSGRLCTMEVIKEYPQKMTLEEIEKKLGYKVEVVSNK